MLKRSIAPIFILLISIAFLSNLVSEESFDCITDSECCTKFNDC